MKERKLGLLGRKVGMTRYFSENGDSMGVTVLEMGPCIVLTKRTDETNNKGRTDGYVALQLGFDPKPVRKLNKAEKGHAIKAGGEDKARRFVRELRVSKETAAKFELGQEVTLADLDISIGALVDVAGRSKGKGFQGVMHRHNFAGKPATHGTHEFFRHGGSIGCRKWPGRVFKGRKMPGHHGDRNVTTQNLEIVAIRAEENVLLVNGSVPGAKNSYLSVRPAIKKNPIA
jgi:large subunit ribosomal protein L3